MTLGPLGTSGKVHRMKISCLFMVYKSEVEVMHNVPVKPPTMYVPHTLSFFFFFFLQRSNRGSETLDDLSKNILPEGGREVFLD